MCEQHTASQTFDCWSGEKEILAKKAGTYLHLRPPLVKMMLKT